MQFSHIVIRKDFIDTLEAILKHDIPDELSNKILFKLKLLKHEDDSINKVGDRGPKEGHT